MKLTEELKGMESRVAGVQALAAAWAARATVGDERDGNSSTNPRAEYYRKRRFVAYYHMAKRGLLHLI